MRIISGKFKGRKLNVTENSDIRPTLDRIKTRLFDIINFQIKDCAVLDLFCGSGSLGIEALSRNALMAVFVDNSQAAIKLLNENLLKLGCQNATAVCSDFRTAIGGIKNKFHIVFLDPPFGSGYYNEAMTLMDKNKLLHDGALIICEHSRENAVDEQERFVLSDKRDIGTVSLSFFRYTST